MAVVTRGRPPLFTDAEEEACREEARRAHQRLGVAATLFLDLPAAELDAGWDPEELITEAAAFPYGTHDDQVDATSQALHRLLGDGRGWSAWIAYLERRAAPAPPAEPAVTDEETADLDPRQAARLAAFRTQYPR